MDEAERIAREARGGGDVSSVGEDFHRERQRINELIAQYAAIGPVGAFGKMMLEQVARFADAALASGDVVKIVRAYAAMRGCE